MTAPGSDSSWKAEELHTHSNLAAYQRPESSPTAALSTTVRIAYPNGDCPPVQSKTVEELSEYGEIARLDTSLGVILGCILVTYFDVRCAQRVLIELVSRIQPFPPAPHDFRTVRVSLSTFALCEVGGFGQFGEVANISIVHGDAIVEFYDMRSAQFLLAAAGSSGSPWIPAANLPDARGRGNPLLGGAIGLSGLGATMGHPAFSAVQRLLGSLQVPNASDLSPSPLARPPGLLDGSGRPGNSGATLTSLAKAALAAEENCLPEPNDHDKQAAERGNRPVRTKVTTKEFEKYDINPDRIASGEDQRTTVMVRNMGGPHARRDFIKFMEKCGLGDRYTFFYMPCKEHRNVPAGFAFVNFSAPEDVLKLYTVLNNGLWRKLNSEQSGKSPAVSYARFQGQEELTKHFSSSVVMHEQDPKKRPIFRHKNAPQEKDKEQDNGATDVDFLPIPTLPTATTSPTGPAKVDMLPKAPPAPELYAVGKEASSDSDLKNVLENGAKEIAALLMRATTTKEACTLDSNSNLMQKSQSLAFEDSDNRSVVDSPCMGA